MNNIVKVLDLVCIIVIEVWLFIELMEFYRACIVITEISDDFVKHSRLGLFILGIIYLRVSYILIHYLMQ
jgi:hypothetical protein